MIVFEVEVTEELDAGPYRSKAHRRMLHICSSLPTPALFMLRTEDLSPLTT